MNKSICAILLGLTLNGCSSFNQVLINVRLKYLGRETVDLFDNYTCEKNLKDPINMEAYTRRKKYFETTGENLYLKEALKELCEELDGNLGAGKDKHISMHEWKLYKGE